MPNNPLAIRESRFERMLFSHAAGVVLAQFERDDGPRHTRSIYIRDAVTSDYERLAAPDDSTSYDSPVVARAVPVVFFNVLTINERGSGNWSGVARADIGTRDIEMIFTRPELVAFAKSDPTWPCQPWVSGLVAASDDGVILTCNIGLPEPRPGGAFHMNYSLFDLDLTRRTLEHLADFHATPSW